MNAARPALREATGEAHQRVDALFAQYDLRDRDSYRRFLSAHAEALIPVEAALDQGGGVAVIEDWANRRRGPLLCADLAALDCGVPAPEPGPVLADRAAAAGALYVLEGSRLGGKLLSRQVDPAYPRNYLNSDQPSEMWRKLLEKLDTVLYDARHLQSAKSSALAVFERFERAGRKWLLKA